MDGQPISERFAHYLPTALVAGLRFVSQIGSPEVSGSQLSMMAETPENAAFRGNPGKKREMKKGG